MEPKVYCEKWPVGCQFCGLLLCDGKKETAEKRCNPCKPTQPECGECEFAKPQTNAGLIRQMSDEELAEWLDAVSKSWYDEGYTKDDESPLMSEYPATANEWISWLKSPVEVDDG